MLETINFFHGISKEEIQKIEQTAERRRYKKGIIIMGKDDGTDYLCVLLSGRVQVYLDDNHCKRITVNTVYAGELFGELAMLSGEPRSANVVVVEDCEVLLMQRDYVMQVIGDFPEFSINLIQRLARKVNSLTEEVSCLALMDVYGRIARVLEQHAASGKTSRLTQQEIAYLIGSSREMVSRILKDLRVGGYIRVENKQIEITRALPKAW